MGNEVRDTENEVRDTGKRTIVYGIIGVLLCVIAILGILVFAAMGRSSQLSKKNKEYASEMKKLEKTVTEKEQEIDTQLAAAEEIKKKNTELSETVAGYETQLAAVEELNNKINELMTSYNELLTEHEKSKGEVESLKKQVETLTAEKEELSKKVKEMEGDITEGIVYWVDEGNAYHTSPQCPMISGSDHIKSGTITDSGKNAACIFC